jgi:hypothetical protein
MAVIPDRRFIYGTFIWPRKHKIQVPFAPSPPTYLGGDTALEIVHEYSASELLGKIYVLGIGGNWTPLAQTQVADNAWYQWFLKNHRFLYFDMGGSGWWEVLHFRIESDETGPYVAVALRYVPPGSIPKGMQEFYGRR